MRNIFALMVVVLALSVPALAQKKRVAKKPAPVVVAASVEPVAPVKKRAPSMTAEGGGQVFRSDAELAREEMRDKRDAGYKKDSAKMNAEHEKAMADLEGDMYALQQKIKSRPPVHQQQTRRASPFKLRQIGVRH